MKMLKILGVILVLLGMTGLVGCETATVKNIVELVQEKPIRACPPEIPELPQRNENGLVILYEQHQEALLIYFRKVEFCSTQAWVA